MASIEIDHGEGKDRHPAIPANLMWCMKFPMCIGDGLGKGKGCVETMSQAPLITRGGLCRSVGLVDGR